MYFFGTTAGHNHHHLLFPERAFKQTDNGTILRNTDVFIIEMPEKLHTELHQAVNSGHQIGQAGIIITKNYLPDQSTLGRIASLADLQRDKLLGYSTEGRITWLMKNLPNDEESEWLRSLLAEQLKFFLLLKEEAV